MSRLKIFTYPEIVLAKKALPVDRFERRERQLTKLAEDMLETMYFAPGIGLAANQVGVLKRLLVLDIDYRTQKNEDDQEYQEGDGQQLAHEPSESPLAPHPQNAEPLQTPEPSDSTPSIRGGKPQMLINPTIIYREGLQTFEEGCLSVPGYFHDVIRSEKIRVQYQTMDGLTKVLDADGLLAVVIQHEMDHLDGKLFIDRIGLRDGQTIKKALKKKKKPA
jgi:peptide deformylase